MDETVTISSIRIGQQLAKKLDAVAKRAGISRAELIRRALEAYLPQFIEVKPKTAAEILDLVARRAGGIPPVVRDSKVVYDENYRTEPL
ncbi:MAG TPA: ribbon-helix-helix domain-containing protein [Candidatus Lokiarchaeia archaeon]|nr:ribbon-helix-helix domain-containing protein [Candidatus Lokiarchaeia archaeon]